MMHHRGINTLIETSANKNENRPWLLKEEILIYSEMCQFTVYSVYKIF